MSRSLSLSLAIIATLVGMVLFGCGGGGRLADGGTPFGVGVGELALRISSAGVSSSRGTLLARAVPPEVVLFEIHVQDVSTETDLVPAVQVNRPTGNTPVTVTIENVPVGDVLVVVLGLDASGTVLVGDKTRVTVEEGINQVVSVTPSPLSPSPSPTSSPSPTPSPSPTIQRFAVVANQGDNNLTSYLIDGTTGALTPKSTIGSGAGPAWVAANNARNTVYVVDAGARTLSAFRIDASGSLSLFDVNFPRPITGTPSATVVEGGGRFVYTAVAGPDTVAGVQVNPTTGAFVRNLAAVATGSQPIDIKFLPPNFIVVATSADVQTFSFDTNGALTFRDSQAVVGGAGTNRSIAVRGQDPGRATGLIYTAVDESTNSRVQVFKVDLTTGSITFTSDVGTAGFPNQVGASGASDFIYVGSVASATITVLKIDPLTASINFVSTHTLPNSVERVQALAMGGDGGSLFATITSGEVQNFIIDPLTGGLTGVNPRALTGTSPVSITVF